MCPTNTRFMPIEEEGFDYFRKIMKQPTAWQRKSTKRHWWIFQRNTKKVLFYSW
jgi:hypothetical protein